MSVETRRACEWTSRALAGLAWLSAACSSGGAGREEAPDPCGRFAEREQGGEATLGSGYDDFLPIGDEIAIIAGPQGGFHLNLNARVRGLELGSTADLLDPRNPSTEFAIYRTGTDERLDIDHCPVRMGYRPEGGYGVLQRGVNVVFDVENEAELEPLFDQEVRLELDVVDADGRHSGDRRVVTVRAPI